MSAHAVALRRWTRQEYERLAAEGFFHPEERLELVEGEIVRMTLQGSPHATAVCLCADELWAACGLRYHVRVQMPLALTDDSEPEPDVAVVVGSPRDYRDAHPTAAALVVEVSDATLPYDRERKVSLYARVGIAECWIVNVLDRCLEVYRRPMQSGAHTSAMLTAPLCPLRKGLRRGSSGQVPPRFRFPPLASAIQACSFSNFSIGDARRHARHGLCYHRYAMVPTILRYRRRAISTAGCACLASAPLWTPGMAVL